MDLSFIYQSSPVSQNSDPDARPTELTKRKKDGHSDDDHPPRKRSKETSHKDSPGGAESKDTSSREDKSSTEHKKRDDHRNSRSHKDKVSSNKQE